MLGSNSLKSRILVQRLAVHIELIDERASENQQATARRRAQMSAVAARLVEATLRPQAPPKDCPSKDKTCDICGRYGHLKFMCNEAGRQADTIMRACALMQCIHTYVMYVCVYLSLYIYISIYIYTTYVSLSKICVYVCVYIYIHTCIHIHTHTHLVSSWKRPGVCFNASIN